MYRAQDKRYAGYIALYYDEKQEEYNGTFGIEEIQSGVEKDDGT